MQTNLLIDGNNLAHRCRHVFSLSDANGLDVSITYGFLKVLSSLLVKFKATTCTVCWDYGIPNFRRLALPEYKANRHQTADPDDLDAYYQMQEDMENFYRQVAELSDYILPILGVLSVTRYGAEADDLLYHASRMLSDGENIIVSGDTDMLQAVNDNTRLWMPSRERLYTTKQVELEYGVLPVDYIYWKALSGDSSDNIMGIMGVGEKTATKLMVEYKDISAIVNAAEGRNPKGRIDGRLGENIRQFGIDRLAKNVYVIALYADRVGARYELLSSIVRWHPCDVKRMKRMLMARGFISLMDGTLWEATRNLTCAQYVTSMGKMRMPIAYAGGRFAV